jgi:hypothetical protein
MADGVGKGAATGGFKGATLGAKLGSVVPGIGTAVGAAGGAAIGAIAGGVKAKKSAEEREKGLQLPTGEDPLMTSRELEIERIAKNIQAGTDSATQTAINEGQAATSGAQSRIARVTGGAPGATVDALLKSQKAGQSATNQAISQSQARLPFFENLAQQLSTRASQRKLELGLLGRAQTSAETAQTGKERNVNFNALLASGLLGSNLEGQSDRIQSLVNQGLGKLGGDVDVLPASEITPIDMGGGNGIPELPANIGGGIGGDANLPVGGLDLGGLGSMGGGVGG